MTNNFEIADEEGAWWLPFISYNQLNAMPAVNKPVEFMDSLWALQIPKPESKLKQIVRRKSRPLSITEIHTENYMEIMGERYISAFMAAHTYILHALENTENTFFKVVPVARIREGLVIEIHIEIVVYEQV